MSRRAHIFPTDRAWFDFLSSTAPHQDVNFWTPKPWGGRFGILAAGDILLFRLKAPLNVIAGGGLFARYLELPLHAAWEVFGVSNGVPDAGTMRASISRLRRETGESTAGISIGCIVLNAPFFWTEEHWIPVPDDYPQNAVRGRGYDLSEGAGRALWGELVTRYVKADAPSGLRERVVNPMPGGFGDPIPRRPRIGQAAFRAILMEAYDTRCAVTGEGTVKVLEAAHIQPFGITEAHDVRNGVLLRSDIHRLFDAGYLTIAPDYVVRVSRLVRPKDGERGGYADLDGDQIRLPREPSLRPDPGLLHWHATTKFIA